MGCRRCASTSLVFRIVNTLYSPLAHCWHRPQREHPQFISPHFGLLCFKFTHFLVPFLQALIVRWWPKPILSDMIPNLYHSWHKLWPLKLGINHSLMINRYTDTINHFLIINCVECGCAASLTGGVSSGPNAATLLLITILLIIILLLPQH